VSDLEEDDEGFLRVWEWIPPSARNPRSGTGSSGVVDSGLAGQPGPEAVQRVQRVLWNCSRHRQQQGKRIE